MRRHAFCLPSSSGMVLLLAAAFLAMPAGAQEPTPAQVPAVTVPPAPPVPTTLDSAIVVVPMRDIAMIERDLEEANAHKVYIEQRMDQAKNLQARAETAIKVKETEINAIEAQLDLAKKMKDEMQKSDLESRKKLAKLEKDLLQSREKLRDQEIRYGKAAREYYEDYGRSFEREMELARMRDRRMQLGRWVTASPSLLTEAQGIDNEIRDLERKTLDAQIQAAEKRKVMAQQEADVAKARKKILESQLKLQRGG